jgi:protein-S-isoprenylcysteine O-methyltransferase Ste14
MTLGMGEMPKASPSGKIPPGIGKRGLVVRAFLQAVSLLILLPPLLFLPAGRLDWPMGWALVGVYIGGLLCTNIWLALFRTELAEERVKKQADVKRWDVLLTSAGNFLMFFVLIPLAGFDKRFSWSPPLPFALHISGLLAMIAGFVLTIWAMASNPFFSSLVRIQTDRSHAVAAGGPYRWARHPGYLAMIAQFLSVPLILGSLWAWIPATAVSGLFILRTHLEDRTLRRELPGYAAYAGRVRYRLLPGIW